MDNKLKLVRQWLKESNLHTFEDVVREAKLTKRQLSIIKRKFLDGDLNYQIASELNVSVETIDKDIKNAYKSIARLI